MNGRQGIVAAIGLAAFVGWGAAGVAVFRAWLDGTPPGGLAATFAAFSTFGTACQALELMIRGYQRAGR